jgi:hypothetical protein
MSRRLAFLPAVLAALASAPAASAAYPAPFAVQGGAGVLGLHGSVRLVAYGAGSSTRLTARSTRTGSLAASRVIPGAFGIPTLTQDGLFGGVSHDGRTLVLQNMGLKAKSRFTLVDTKSLVPRQTVVLRGTFGYDALSPDASTLYLIQHTSVQDIQHYVVRAYDLAAHRLLPGRIADKTQKSWIMQGWAVSRATTANGRWAYTLYANPGGYPFVHALDTVRGVAHCIGLPWMSSDQSPVWKFTLGVRGGSLLVLRSNGTVWKRVDRATWRVTS